MRGATTQTQPSVAQHLSSLAFLMEKIKHSPMDGKLGPASSWTGTTEHATGGWSSNVVDLRACHMMSRLGWTSGDGGGVPAPSAHVVDHPGGRGGFP